MLKSDQVMRVYEDLAYLYDRKGAAKLRDCYLILAADAAFAAGWEDVAERLRIQLLSFNPHHLLRPYVSFADALRSPDIQRYIADLRATHPPELAGRELQELARAGGPESGAATFPAKKTATSSRAEGPGEDVHTFPFQGVAEDTRPVAPPAP